MRKGFTLIELLIVIAIIGILTVAFLPTLRGGQSKARDAARIALLGDISTALENNEGSWPTNTTSGTGECLSLNAANQFVKWLGRIPSVPKAGGDLCNVDNQIYYKFIAATTTASKAYFLAVQLEDTKSSNTTATAVAAINGVNDAASFLAINGTGGKYYIVGGF